MKYVIVILLSLLVGCTTFKDAGKIAVEGAFISAEINSGNVSNTLHSIELTSYEKQVIVNALSYQNKFEEKWKSSVKEPILLAARFVELNADYIILKSHYSATKAIVIDNWDKYPEVVKFRLLSYQEHADNLNNSVANLNAVGDRNQVLQEMLYFSTTITQIAMVIK